MSDGIEISDLGGNCPVQGEGTFDGVPFYFRARGTQVTCDVGANVGSSVGVDSPETPAEEWEWRGPEYEWPDAGWISDDLARAFIGEAYAAWKKRTNLMGQRGAYRRRNDNQSRVMQCLHMSARISRELGEAGKPAADWLMKQAHKASGTP